VVLQDFYLIVVYLMSSCQKRPNLHTTSPLKAPNRLKSLKLAWRFVLTSCDIYQNPFTQEKILKFWVSNKKYFFMIGFHIAEFHYFFQKIFQYQLTNFVTNKLKQYI
jgi:hypothetical protein